MGIWMFSIQKCVLKLLCTISLLPWYRERWFQHHMHLIFRYFLNESWNHISFFTISYCLTFYDWQGHGASFPVEKLICNIPFCKYKTNYNLSSFFACSIYKMFSSHKDDKKRVEKALESASLPTGRVRQYRNVIGLKSSVSWTNHRYQRDVGEWDGLPGVATAVWWLLGFHNIIISNHWPLGDVLLTPWPLGDMNEILD